MKHNVYFCSFGRSQGTMTALHLACDAGHENIVESLISAGVDIHKKDKVFTCHSLMHATDKAPNTKSPP